MATVRDKLMDALRRARKAQSTSKSYETRIRADGRIKALKLALKITSQEDRYVLDKEVLSACTNP